MTAPAPSAEASATLASPHSGAPSAPTTRPLQPSAVAIAANHACARRVVPWRSHGTRRDDIAPSTDNDKLGGTIEADIFIPLRPEAVYRFFVEPVLVAEWLGAVKALDARPGGDLCIATSFDGVVRGQFLVLAPPSRVAWTWERQDGAAAPARVDVELVARHEGTLVQLALRGDRASLSPIRAHDFEHRRAFGDPQLHVWRQALAKLYAAAVRSITS